MSKLEKCAKRLIKHGFQVEIVPSVEAAGAMLRDQIQKSKPQIVSYGDSMTVRSTGIVQELKADPSITLYDGFDPALSRKQRLEVRREALMCDFFFTGVNAVSEQGSLHWLDMIGNRIAPVIFGPERVVLLVGRNKIVPSSKKAAQRIKKIAAPANAARHTDFRTPCIKTGKCCDCNSPDRICNARLTLERCFPKGRILVILIDADAGL